MKIGIMTFPNSHSYGAALQMYGLYRATEKIGASAEVINYQNEYMKTERHMEASKSNWGKKLFRKALHYRQTVGFRNFEKSMVKYPSKVISSSQALQEVGKRYDGVICGSDQVWNPEITGSDMNYFLEFCGPATKRISYAPSFGRTDLPMEFEKKVQKELKKFHRVSVREFEGQELLRPMLEAEVPLVSDPSFFLTREEWSKEEKKHSAADEPYVLYYTVHGSKTLMRFCKQLAKKKNMKVVAIGGNAIKRITNRDKSIEYACDVSPREWLYLVHHADCVVTNSFHGTAFSINYQKDFYVEFSSLTNSRLEHIVRTMGLKDRVVQDGCGLTDSQIDYKNVNQIVNTLREVSLKYLHDAIISE